VRELTTTLNFMTTERFNELLETGEAVSPQEHHDAGTTAVSATGC